MFEHLRDLAAAIRLNDQAAAETALDLIARDRDGGGDTFYGDAIAAGRRDAAARGRMSALPPATAMPLPMEGTTRQSVLGDDVRQRVRPNDPRYPRHPATKRHAGTRA